MNKKILAIVFALCGNIVLTNDLTPEQLETAHKACESGDIEACRTLGWYYYNDGNDKVQAAEILAKACEKKDILSCSYAGSIYYKLKDFVKAHEHLSKVCGAQGVPKDLKKVETLACVQLGHFYINGRGVRQDFTKAKEYLTKACNSKVSEACYSLGVLYQNGGVRPLATTKEYYGKACDLGDQEGCDEYKNLNQAGH